MNNVPLDSITLRPGSHDDRSEGVCLMEAAAWFAGETHSDRPKCVCPVLNAMGIGLNDCMPDDRERLRLLQFVPKVVGTAGDGHAQARGFMAADWIIRTFTPTWCELGGIDVSALRGLPVIRSWDDVTAAQPLLFDARGRADAAWNAAWGVVSMSAAGAAVGNAAGAAARAAVGAAAWDAARDRAEAAARDAAWNAAEAAAAVAARAALTPISDALRADAVRLFSDMIALGAEQRTTYSVPVSEVVLL